VKGRTLEAIFSHALRESRVADKVDGSHKAAWDRMRPRFDAELEKTKTGNFEFSTLAGAYLANLDYLSGDWLRTAMPQIFPIERPANFVAAIAGLPYTAATRRTYMLLRDEGVIDFALRIEVRGRDTRKALVDRLMLAYLWGDEALNSPRIAYLFDNTLLEDLKAAAWFLWTTRGDELSPEQEAKIIAFWDRCVVWAQSQKEVPKELLGTLATLAWVLPDAAGRNGELLATVAPHISATHATYDFLEQLNRLVEKNPTEVSDILGAVVKSTTVFYDYENRLKSLLSKLAELGHRKEVLDYCHLLKDVNGIPGLFSKLRKDAGLA
jgi:hypothetical protein